MKMEKETYNVFMRMNTAKHKTEHHRKQSRDQTKRRKKLNNRRTFCKTPTPRPIKKTSLAQAY